MKNRLCDRDQSATNNSSEDSAKVLTAECEEESSSQRLVASVLSVVDEIALALDFRGWLQEMLIRIL